MLLLRLGSTTSQVGRYLGQVRSHWLHRRGKRIARHQSAAVGTRLIDSPVVSTEVRTRLDGARGVGRTQTVLKLGSELIGSKAPMLKKPGEKPPPPIDTLVDIALAGCKLAKIFEVPSNNDEF